MNIRAIISLLCLLALAGRAVAQDQLVLGVPLEPPNLDPTSGAAAAVADVVRCVCESRGDAPPALTGTGGDG